MIEANVRTAKLNGISFKQRKCLANPGVKFFSLFLFVFDKLIMFRPTVKLGLSEGRRGLP
jgi:hypothetical protein